MLFGSFVRVFAWLTVGIVVCLVLAFLAADLRLADWLFGSGTSAYDAQHSIIKHLRDTYGLNRANVDFALKTIGLGFTIVLGGVLPTLHAWQFGYFNLPMRLQNYADRVRKEHMDDRAVVLAALSPRNLRGDPPAVRQRRFLDALRHLVGMEPIQRARRRIATDVEALDGDVRVFGAKLDCCKANRITSHVSDGLRLAAEARTLEQGSTEQLTRNQAAMREFSAALGLKGDDLDALEQAAKMAKLLNLDEQLHLYLDNMEHAAGEQKRPARRARALRFQAELLGESSRRAALRDARLRLETALEVLDIEDESGERPLELALVNEQLGALHLKRGTPTLVEDRLKTAETIFGNLASAEGEAGVGRVNDLRNQLVAVQEGGDEPEDQPDTPSAAPAKSTHVNSASLPVYAQRGQTSAVVRELPPFSAVAILSEDPDWPLISKDGETLGYVAAADLHRLN